MWQGFNNDFDIHIHFHHSSQQKGPGDPHLLGAGADAMAIGKTSRTILASKVTQLQVGVPNGKKKHPKMVIKWGWKMDEKCEQSSKSSLLSLRCQGCGSILQHRSLIRLVFSRPHWANHDPPSSRHGHRAVARPKGHGCCNWVKPACAGRKVSCKGPFFWKYTIRSFTMKGDASEWDSKIARCIILYLNPCNPSKESYWCLVRNEGMIYNNH